MPPAPPRWPPSLRVAVMRTSRRLRLESTDQISPGQFSVLAVLDRQGPSTPREPGRRRARAAAVDDPDHRAARGASGWSRAPTTRPTVARCSCR
nr:hypothetical protein [Angustibacter aerolatus]